MTATLGLVRSAWGLALNGISLPPPPKNKKKKKRNSPKKNVEGGEEISESYSGMKSKEFAANPDVMAPWEG